MTDNDAIASTTCNNVCAINLEQSEKLLHPDKTQNSSLHIEFDNLCYSIHQKGTIKPVLCNVTGSFDSGKLTMIVGPSGAGKTTLLKIITGELLINVQGTITVNGAERNRRVFRKQICYVPQKFTLMPLLTTKESLYIAARLKLNPKKSNEEIYFIINEIVNNLGMTNCLDTLTQCLSSGEQKKLSIGLEMITQPPVLFLDEPTSGLDSVASNQLIDTLQNMTATKCTVVCVIHQPNSQIISQFNDIMVLHHGKCIYCGPRNKILEVFNTAGFTCPNFYNIIEFVLEVITKQSGKDLDKLYEICKNEYKKRKLSNECLKDDMSTTAKDKLKKKVLVGFENNTNSMWQQQKVLFSRALICIKRDMIMTKLRCITHVFVAFLIGVLFYDIGNDAEKVHSNIAGLFFYLLFLFYGNSLSTIQLFPTEAAITLREHLNNWYYLRSYYSVKILMDFLMQIFCSTSFLMIAYYMMGEPMEISKIFQMWIICSLVTILAQTVGILVGTTFDAQIGTFIIPVTTIPLLLFSGFFIKVNELPIYLKPLSYISFFRYAFEGMIQAIYIDRSNLTCAQIYCYFRSPKTILKMIGVPTISFNIILIVLSMWIVCLHLCAYSILSWKIYNAKR